MGCEIINVNGFVGFACSRGRRPKQCRWCSRPGTKLCDAPLKGRTCDAPCCDAHATSIGTNRDVCPDHVSVRV